MDTFEAARLKHAKNKERKERGMDAPVEAVEPQVPVLLAPKEKSGDAVISVQISLPHKGITFVLTKKDVLNNVARSRLTPEEFKSAMIKGLEPLLGAVKCL